MKKFDDTSLFKNSFYLKLKINFFEQNTHLFKIDNHLRYVNISSASFVSSVFLVDDQFSYLPRISTTSGRISLATSLFRKAIGTRRQIISFGF